MPISDEIIRDLGINRYYEGVLKEALTPIRLTTRVDILVVVDTQIDTQPGIGFGIGTVIELIRSAKVGCMRFNVDIAERSGGSPNVVASPAPFAPRYTGFRFDMTDDGADVIDRYEQIWCFGFEPGNDGGPDSNIEQPSAFPATDSELAKLASWMKLRKGGLFATGDHDYLGASMCHRMPRIGTMRLWTNADGVPPIGTPDRIDTLRPPSPAFEPGNPGGPAPMANNPQQGDLTPQPIEWVPWSRVRTSFFIEKVRPHPVLCHPRLGPIDVMPDHAHEGLCRDTGTVPLGGSYDFDGAGDQPEYPNATGGGPRPEPTVIAYGSTLGDPPYNFAKGSQPARPRFPMISVYDGHAAGVGRVATDSTWHHWMDVNIGQIKEAGGTDWDKISCYFTNLAVWLSPPGYTTRCLSLHVLACHFHWVGFQEFSPKLKPAILGRALRENLLQTYGPCWVTQFVHDFLDYFDIRVLREIEFPPTGPDGPDPCLSCPPLETVEDVILGGLVQQSFEMAQKMHRAAAARKPAGIQIEALEKLLAPGVAPALASFGKEWQEDMKRGEKVMSRFFA
ncbi:MAG: hypothetical protein QNJ67_21315 [Kiloniellales bacterium]|nr:hypothetical protein [Kiloniellales bacterium]